MSDVKDGRIQAKIIGIDLSADSSKTDACIFTFREEAVEVSILPARARGKKREPIDDHFLRGLLRSAGCNGEGAKGTAPVLIGIDAPFGWPTPFASALALWRTTGKWPDWDHERTTQGPAADRLNGWDEPAEFLAYRVTDRFVRSWRRQETGNPGVWPQGLSVATDHISVTAFRVARMLSTLPAVDRRGESGPVVEVYPGAALAEWGVYPNYRTDPDASPKFVGRLLDGLTALGQMGELDTRQVVRELQDGEVGRQMAMRHHVFDAVVAAVCAWAAAVGLTYPSPGTQRKYADGTKRFIKLENKHRDNVGLGVATAETVAEEGWIHHPAKSPEDILGVNPLRYLANRPS